MHQMMIRANADAAERAVSLFFHSQIRPVDFMADFQIRVAHGACRVFGQKALLFVFGDVVVDLVLSVHDFLHEALVESNPCFRLVIFLTCFSISCFSF